MKLKLLSTLILFNILAFFTFQSCKDPEQHFSCTDQGCQGTYSGPEFIGVADDVAHQFSNVMSRVVGDHLKEQFKKGRYVQVDFPGIKMTTDGMNNYGNVVYTLYFPFKEVRSPCEAYTSFDHVGGWGHAPELEIRKRALKKELLPGEELAISPLKSTQEGLQEYWIQWKNKDLQAACGQ